MTSLQLIEGSAHHVFLPQDLIRFSLPYRPIKTIEWIRVNGNEEYAITAGRIRDAKTGEMKSLIPSGKIARQILLWCCTQAKLTKCKTIKVPSSLKVFVQSLGLPWTQTTGREVSNQFQALINCTLQITTTEEVDGERKIEYRRLLIAQEATLWFVDGDVGEKNRSEITLSDDLYRQLKKAVPIDKDAYDALQGSTKSPLVLDIYLWLCLRLYGRSKPSRVTWKQLHAQFGSQAELKRFKITFREALVKAKEAYPQARIVEYKAESRGGFHGFHIYPSPHPRKRFRST